MKNNIFAVLSIIIAISASKFCIIASLMFVILAIMLFPKSFDYLKKYDFIANNRKIIISSALILGLLLIGIFKNDEEEKQDNQKYTTEQTQQKKEKIFNEVNIKWKENINKNELIGKWGEIQYYSKEDNFGGNVGENDNEKMIWEISNNKVKMYKKYEDGNNAHPWDYVLKGNHLKVITPNTKQIIYDNIVKLSSDGKFMKLDRKNDLVYIYKKID